MRRWFRREKKAKREPLDLVKLDEEILVRYHLLLVQQMEHDRKVRRKAIRLSKKYSKHQPWVI